MTNSAFVGRSKEFEMLLKDNNEFSKLSDEVDSLYWQIVKMQSEFKIIEYNGSIEEYDEALKKINVVVDEYCEKTEKMQKMLKMQKMKNLSQSMRRKNLDFDKQVAAKEEALKIIDYIDKYLEYADDTAEYERIKKYILDFEPCEYLDETKSEKIKNEKVVY